MFMHSDFLLVVAEDRRRDLIAEADRRRLLSAARRARREQTEAANGAHRTHAAKAEKLSAARGQPAGTLAACGPHVAAPAR